MTDSAQHLPASAPKPVAPVSVAYIHRDGRNSRGKQWHNAIFKEDGSIDLPEGTLLYTEQPGAVNVDYKTLWQEQLEANTRLAEYVAKLPTPGPHIAWLDVETGELFKSQDDVPMARGDARFENITALVEAEPAPRVPYGYAYEVYCLPEQASDMEWVETFARYKPKADPQHIRNVVALFL